MPTSRKVVVLGAKGGTGKLVVEQLVKEKKHDVVAVARSVENEESIEEGVRWVQGDVQDEKKMREVFSGAEAIIFAASASKGWSFTNSNTPKYVDFLAVENTAKIAVDLKVPRYCLVSSAFVTRPNSFVYLLLNTMFGRIMHWKRRGEMSLIQEVKNQANSITAYTIVRPGGLNHKEAKGFESLRIGQGDNISGSISRQDVASVIVQALDSDKTKNTVFEAVSYKEKPTAALYKDWADVFSKLISNDGSHIPA